jgi:hypothetical protein
VTLIVILKFMPQGIASLRVFRRSLGGAIR